MTTLLSVSTAVLAVALAVTLVLLVQSRARCGDLARRLEESESKVGARRAAEEAAAAELARVREAEEALTTRLSRAQAAAQEHTARAAGLGSELAAVRTELATVQAALATRAAAPAEDPAVTESRLADLATRGRRQHDREDRLLAREHRLEADVHRLEAESSRLQAESDRLAERDAALTDRADSLEVRAAELAEAAERHRHELERVAGLTAEHAKAELVAAIEHTAKREAALLVRELEAEAREEGETRARAIVVDSIARIASEQTAESVVSVLHLPSDEMKGRIIGREGRNIRTFEAVTGVNVVIDDTPEAVLLSCFDPVRREVGRVTLEALVADGRIHPHRIEEVYERSLAEVEKLTVRAGEDALVAVGIDDMHPDLIATLGRLRYRTSYGQNVLKHLIETAHLAGLMAAELKMDPRIVKRAAFLHDIGKALTHEVEGSHAIVGADLARRHGEDPEVVHAIEAHHNEVAPETVEAVLTQASDSCSGGRPGARRETLEIYVKRLSQIEEIAGSRAGVEKVFAMQAGREVRVMVHPDQVDDVEAQVLARDVAAQIQADLTYPGQIRVTVVRETRASEIAH